MSCDFDQDFCGLIPNENMVRWSGKSPSKLSGPSDDHTTGDYGYYSLCDARLLVNPTDKCTLKQIVNSDVELTFSFWYHMYGSQIGTLELIAYNDSNSFDFNDTLSYQVIWSLTGRQSNEWLFANVTLPSGNYTVR